MIGGAVYLLTFKNMKAYYVNNNEQSNGDHEVHESGCSYMPKPENRTFLGSFINCKYAINEAKKYYDDVDGCYYCCPDCHTS